MDLRGTLRNTANSLKSGSDPVFFFPTHKLMATVFIPCLLLLMAPITVVTVSISTDKNKVLAVVCQMEVEDRVCRKAKVQTPG